MSSQENNILIRIFYNGDKLKFKWEKFVSVHMELHFLYIETGDTITQSIKIMNLHKNISDVTVQESTIDADFTSSLENDNSDKYRNFLNERITD